MNKTISINLGGFFFHIDEDAYSKLNRYLDAVKRSLSPEGREEIIKDIESRIAELFQNKIQNEKQVIGSKEVDDMIAVMGQPEDYKIDDEPIKKESKSSQSSNYYYPSKRLYKDEENKILGGVCAGLGHYFSIDPIWVRILFIISPWITFGTALVIYLVLWIALPKAITTTQKLEMRGMPINITNIEKKVKEGIEDITSKINDIDTDKIATNFKQGTQNVGSTIEDIFTTLFKIIGKIVGIFITMFSSIALIGLFVGTIFMFFSTTIDHVHLPWNEYLRAENYTDFPMWILYILSFFAVAIPIFFFLILGLKLLITNIKSIGNYAKYSLLAIWILSIIFLVYFGLRQASEVSFDSKTVEKKEIVLNAKDTLKIKMNNNIFYSKNMNHNVDFKFTFDEKDNEIIYSNNVRIHLMKTSESKPFIQIEKTANGKSNNDAKKRAEKISYNFEIKGNNITLDNYFITARSNKFRAQEVHIYIYLPNGTMVYPDDSISDYLTNHNSDINMYYGEENNTYQLQNEKFKCLDCPKEMEQKETETDWETEIEKTEPVDIKGNIQINDKNVDIKINDNGVNINTK